MTVMARVLMVAGVAAVTAVCVPSASAATLGVSPAPQPHYEFAADPGQATRVTATSTATDYVFDDPASPISVTGAPCVAVTPNRATCPIDSSMGPVTVRGSDVRDLVTLSITTGHRSEIQLGQGNDVLEEGQSSGIGTDSIDGGLGRDRISYAERPSPVAVDLLAQRGLGYPGENDVVSSVEDATGGASPDRLTGNFRDNRLDGGPGADVLKGAGGSDLLIGGLGRDAFSGGAGDDYIDASEPPDELLEDPLGERIDCGSGLDRVRAGDNADALRPDCERGQWVTTDSVTDVDLKAVSLDRRLHTAVFRLRCLTRLQHLGPVRPARFGACRGRLEVQENDSSLLGGRSFTVAAGGTLTLPVRIESVSSLPVRRYALELSRRGQRPLTLGVLR